jgi:nucleotide-binding universal stress UspA family protein
MSGKPVMPMATMLLILKGEPAMLKTILVPLDGSERAEYVLPLAARLIQNTGGRLVLLRVVNIATDYWPTTYPLIMQAAIDGELEEATTYLERVAAEAPLAGLEVVTTTRHGTATPVILATATEYNADLILICSHGRTGMAHVIMGSIAEKIARHSVIPVLIIREKEGLPETSPTEISQPLRVLIPLDGSAYAQAVLEPVADLLTALASPAQKAAIHLVRVVEGTEQKNGMQRALRGLSKAKCHLSRMTELIREGAIASAISEHQLPVTWSVAYDTDVTRAIVRAAETGEDAEGAGVFGGCELIAMSTHGRSGLHRLAIGSVTERVLHSTKRPLLIIRPSEMVDRQKSFLEEEESVIGYRP